MWFSIISAASFGSFMHLSSSALLVDLDYCTKTSRKLSKRVVFDRKLTKRVKILISLIKLRKTTKWVLNWESSIFKNFQNWRNWPKWPLLRKWTKRVKIRKNNWKLVKIGEKLRNDHNSQNWSKLESISKMVAFEKRGEFPGKFWVSIIPWQGYFYDLFFFFPFPFCPRFFSLLRACCNFLASLSAFFSALIASRRFSRNIDESQVGLLRYGLSSAKVRTRRRWLMFLHNRLSSRRNFWNQN